MNELIVELSKEINAPITTVFDAWLDPSTLAKFMMPMSGMPEPDVENTPKVGGEFKIVMHAGDNDLPHTGQYLEIERPNRLKFTWQSHASIDGSEVTLAFSQLSDNQTQVKLTHIKFIDEQTRSNHEGGWASILTTLNGVVS